MNTLRKRVNSNSKGPLSTNVLNLPVAAALSGVGLVCTLEDSIRDHLAAGRLVRVLED